MSDDELAEIEGRVMAAIGAHPLPWRWDDDTMRSPPFEPHDEWERGLPVIETDAGFYPPDEQAYPFFERCAADLLALISEVRRLKAERSAAAPPEKPQ